MQAEQLDAEAAQGVGRLAPDPATPITPTLCSDSTTGTPSISRYRSRSRSTRSTYSGSASGTSARLIVVRDSRDGGAQAHAEEVPVLRPPRPEHGPEPHGLLEDDRDGRHLGVAHLALPRPLAVEHLFELLELALEDLGLLAQPLADLGLLRDEVAEQHERRQRDHQQRSRLPRDREDAEPEDDRRDEHRPREEPGDRVLRHPRLGKLLADVPRLDPRAAVEQQRSAALEDRLGLDRREVLHHPDDQVGVAERESLAGDHAQTLDAPAVHDDAVRRVEIDDLDG